MDPSIPHKFQQTITHERLLQTLRYDPSTGEFFWLVARRCHGPWIHPGDKVKGTLNVHGYMIIGLDRKRYQAQRLAWFYHYGDWPNGEVDHISRDILDNRIENLRLAPHRTLQRGNQKRRKDNQSGFKGVTANRGRGGRIQSKPWRAVCCGRHLGAFNTPEEAHAAYMKAAYRVFGEFANGGEI